MTPDEKTALQATVKLSVTEAIQPIYEKLNKHETAIALTQQELKEGLRSGHAQGARIGDLEKEYFRLRTDRKWIGAIWGIVLAVSMGVLFWWLNKGGA